MELPLQKCRKTADNMVVSSALATGNNEIVSSNLNKNFNDSK
jgi:hypothetical protein